MRRRPRELHENVLAGDVHGGAVEGEALRRAEDRAGHRRLEECALLLAALGLGGWRARRQAGLGSGELKQPGSELRRPAEVLAPGGAVGAERGANALRALDEAAALALAQQRGAGNGVTLLEAGRGAGSDHHDPGVVVPDRAQRDRLG